MHLHELFSLPRSGSSHLQSHSISSVHCHQLSFIEIPLLESIRDPQHALVLAVEIFTASQHGSQGGDLGKGKEGHTSHSLHGNKSR